MGQGWVSKRFDEDGEEARRINLQRSLGKQIEIGFGMETAGREKGGRRQGWEKWQCCTGKGALDTFDFHAWPACMLLPVPYLPFPNYIYLENLVKNVGQKLRNQDNETTRAAPGTGHLT